MRRPWKRCELWQRSQQNPSPTRSHWSATSHLSSSPNGAIHPRARQPPAPYEPSQSCFAPTPVLADTREERKGGTRANQPPHCPPFIYIFNYRFSKSEKWFPSSLGLPQAARLPRAEEGAAAAPGESRHRGEAAPIPAPIPAPSSGPACLTLSKKKLGFFFFMYRIVLKQ